MTALGSGSCQVLMIAHTDGGPVESARFKMGKPGTPLPRALHNARYTLSTYITTPW